MRESSIEIMLVSLSCFYKSNYVLLKTNKQIAPENYCKQIDEIKRNFAHQNLLNT